MSTERKLTERERKRAELVEEKTRALEAQGYVRKDQTISIVFANVMAFVWTIPALAVFLPWFILQNRGVRTEHSFGSYLLFLLVLFALTVVHEGLHGLTWGAFAEHGRKSIEFGFMAEMLTPYCTCLEPLTKFQYILGSFMPCLVLGILPCVVSVFTGSLFWLVMGLAMIMGAGGDLTVIQKLFTYKPTSREWLILDHPTECGFIVFEKQA